MLQTILLHNNDFQMQAGWFTRRSVQLIFIFHVGTGLLLEQQSLRKMRLLNRILKKFYKELEHTFTLFSTSNKHLSKTWNLHLLSAFFVI